MTISKRPTPLHPAIDSFSDLAEYVERRMAALDADCYDDETIGHIGPYRYERSLGGRMAYEDVRDRIREAVAAERRAVEQDRADEAYKDLDPVADALEIRRLAGDR